MSAPNPPEAGGRERAGAGEQPSPEGSTSIAAKVAYVKAQGQTRAHHCHWPGCTAQVPPAMWGCKPHWYRLPADLRRRVWLAYRPTQEVTQTPSRAYREVAQAVQAWIAEHAGTGPRTRG